MTNIAFIPVRGGSKSIPYKNIRDFCGKPLVYWTVKSAVELTEIDKVVVATDDIRIKSTVLSFGFDKVEVYDRDVENSQDSSSTESVILEYLGKTNLSSNTNFILVQATSPLLSSSDLALGIKKMECHDSVISCVRSKRFFWTKGGESYNYDYKKRPRRQDFEGMFMENGAFYISKVLAIVNSQCRISGNIGIVEMPEYTAVEIDEEDDWHMAEKLLSRKINKSRESKGEISLFVSDVDGVMTDAGMYYGESGEELKKFNTHDGMAFQLLRENGIKTAIVTSETTQIVERRALKLKVDYLYQGKKHGGKLDVVKDICKTEGISLSQVAYIGDDINCFELLSSVGYAACPSDALDKIKKIPGIDILSNRGGQGVVREFVSKILNH